MMTPGRAEKQSLRVFDIGRTFDSQSRIGGSIGVKRGDDMKRRDLFWLSHHAVLSALTVSATSRSALLAQKKSQSPTDSLEQRVANVLQAYDGQGNHRTGTEVDNVSARWLAKEAHQAGADVSLEPFSVSR